MNLASVSGLQQVYRDFSKSVGLQECPQALGGRIQKRILLAEGQQRQIVHEVFVTLVSTSGLQQVCGPSGMSESVRRRIQERTLLAEGQQRPIAHEAFVT